MNEGVVSSWSGRLLGGSQACGDECRSSQAKAGAKEVQDIPGSSHGWCELRHEGVTCSGVAGEGPERPGWRGT